MTDRETRGSARETTIGEQRALLAQPATLDIGRRIEHLLHAWSTLGTFIANDNDFAGNDFFAEDAFDSSILAFVDASGACELENRFIDASGLDDATVGSKISEENREATFG